MASLASVEPQSGRTIRVGERDIFVVEAGRRTAPPHASWRRTGRERTVQFFPKHSRAGAALPADRAGPAGLRQIDERPRTEGPFGDLARLDARHARRVLGVARAHVLGNSLGGACALRHALEAPDRVDRLVLLGPGGIDTSRRPADEGLLHLLDYYSGEGPTREKFEQFLRKDLVFDGAALPDALIDALRREHRSRGRRKAAAGSPEGAARPSRSRPHARSAARRAGSADAGPLGRRGSREPGERRPVAAGADAELRPLPVQPHRPLGAVGARGRVQRGDDRTPVAFGDRLTRPPCSGGSRHERHRRPAHDDLGLRRGPARLRARRLAPPCRVEAFRRRGYRHGARRQRARHPRLPDRRARETPCRPQEPLRRPRARMADRRAERTPHDSRPARRARRQGRRDRRRRGGLTRGRADLAVHRAEKHGVRALHRAQARRRAAKSSRSAAS